MDDSESAADGDAPSAGILPAMAGVAAFAVAGLFLANSGEAPEVFVTGGFVFLAVGLYLVIVGAVARGVQVTRR